jgi:Holliday junction DNA helicase RuvB
MSTPSVTATKKNGEDTALDAALRPQQWDDFIGQERVKKNLRILIDAARQRKEPMEHVLFAGPAGLGKTSMAHLVAREMQSSIRITSGPAIERVGDLASILTNLLPGDILFIDEVHRLNKLIEEVLYPAMESRTLDIVIGKGPSARTIQLELPPFTLIAATTRPGLLSSPLRSRFGSTFRLEFYTPGELERIIARSAAVLGVALARDAAPVLAQSARATPRIANRLLKRCRDYAQVHADGAIARDIVVKTLALLEVDELGLEPMDRALMRVIIEKFNGGPVGVQSLAAAASEEEDAITDIYEPFLMQLGFVERTPRGRIVTEAAYAHLGLAGRRAQTLL